MDNSFQENEHEKTAVRQLEARIDAAYPHGWFVAVDNGEILAASADFDELEGMLRALGKEPRDILVVEAGGDRYDYVTIFFVSISC